MRPIKAKLNPIKKELAAVVGILWALLISGPAFGGSGAGYLETTCSTNRGTLEARIFAPDEDVLVSGNAIVHIYDPYGNTVDRLHKPLQQMFLQAYEKSTVFYRDATAEMASCEFEIRDRVVRPAHEPVVTHNYVSYEKPEPAVTYVYSKPRHSHHRVILERHHRHRTKHVVIHGHGRHHHSRHVIIKKHPKPRHHHRRVIIKRKQPSWSGHIRVNL